jgi:hypothetical protein
MYLTDKNKNFESDFEEAKKQLKELHDYNSVFEELDRPFEAQSSMHIDNNAFMQKQLLISEIQGKQEITHKLNSLVYNIGWLKSAIIIKDDIIINKAINNILKHENTSINAIVSELNSLKNKIDKFENLHMNLLKNSISLDAKTLLEQDFRKNHKNLNNLHNKQKSVLTNLSSIFVKLTKDSVIKNKNK